MVIAVFNGDGNTDIAKAYGAAAIFPLLLPQTYSTENVLTGNRAGCIFLGGAVDADVYDLYPMRSLWRL